MKYRNRIVFIILALAGITAAKPALAELLSSSNPTIRNDLCLGASCLDVEAFNLGAQDG